MTRVLAISLLAALLAPPLPAAEIPVFRTALEEWPLDKFELWLTSPGRVNSGTQELLDLLRHSLSTTPDQINLTLTIRDLKTLSAEERSARPALAHIAQNDTMVLLPPKSWNRDRPVWSGSSKGSNLTRILSSRVGQKCTDHLLGGASIVWLIVKGTKWSEDSEAASRLKRGLTKAQQELVLPEIRNSQLQVSSSVVPLKLNFVTMTATRNGGSSSTFLQILASTHPKAPDETFVIPIFGRGRTTGAIPLSELTPEKVFALCRSLCAAESKTKSNMPGFDLLFATDWETRLHPDKVLKAAPIPAPAPRAKREPPPRARNFNPFVIVMAVGALSLAMVFFAGCLALKERPKTMA